MHHRQGMKGRNGVDADGAAAELSSFANRLNHLIHLTEDELGYLHHMEARERPVQRGEILVHEGAPVDELYVVKDGWAIATAGPLKERSQTLRIFLPGDVIGLPGLGVRVAPHQARMVTDGVLCPFPKSHMTEVFREAPRLAALFMAIAGLDQVTVRDRLAMMGAGDARQRMAHFLLDIHERLLIANPTLGKRFRLPLRQVDIAEVLGLTKVYVNRLLRAFSDEGLIEIERPYIRILRRDAMIDMSDYVNRYAQLDIGWFPTPMDRP
ncbi:Crp/Fnr family transcriptional regulator [Pseudooceanicola sp.]|uniref:Crp/Fnr family transcriptional regulator n=1 Tax=Pseudooceanicola sp. TaxID=1914328 RepID=UPI0035C6D586